MKKILATVLALTMIVGMSITAFAATYTSIPAENPTFEITATYADNKDDYGSVVYSYDIEWEAMTFTYSNASTNYVWDPTDLAYEVASSKTDAGWVGDTEKDITVTNRSNGGIKVEAQLESDVFEASEAVTCPTAVGAGEGGVNAATTRTITISVKDNATIAATTNVTVTLVVTAA